MHDFQQSFSQFMRKLPNQNAAQPDRAVLSADRLKASLLQLKGQDNLHFLEDEKLREKKMWRLMMQYLSQNPSQLLNAIPSPDKRTRERKEQNADYLTSKF